MAEIEDRHEPEIFTISQATRAVFTDMFFKNTFLFFIQSGEKHIHTQQQNQLVGHEGDIVIFVSGSMVTMENRPVIDKNYNAIGVGFSQQFIENTFPSPMKEIPRVSTAQIISGQKVTFLKLLKTLKATLADTTLPEVVKQYRLREPLIWLHSLGIKIPTQTENNFKHQLRQLLETDLARSWSVDDAAQHFSMSEATLRRRLSCYNQGFSNILSHSRLERGLTLLQTTDLQISQVALDCGFKTPSHFSDCFRRRFNIRPKDIRQLK